MLEWLGDQAPTLERVLSTGGSLDLLEVYTREAKASQEVVERGGTAILLGLRWGRTFQRLVTVGSMTGWWGLAKRKEFR